MRIAKYISHSGYCSRRNAEKLMYKNKELAHVKDNLFITN